MTAGWVVGGVILALAGLSCWLIMKDAARTMDSHVRHWPRSEDDQ